MTDRTEHRDSWRLRARHAVLVDLARNGSVVDKSGRAAARLIERVPIVGQASPANRVKLLVDLAEDGYIERDVGPRKTYRITLTDAGRARASVDGPITEKAYATLYGRGPAAPSAVVEPEPASPEPEPELTSLKEQTAAVARVRSDDLTRWGGFVQRAVEQATLVLDDMTQTLADGVADRIMARYGWTPSGSMIVDLSAQVAELKEANRDLQRQLDEARRPQLSFDVTPANGEGAHREPKGYADSGARAVRDERARRYVERAVNAGWSVTTTSKSHLRFASPTGQVVIVPGTPSDHRSMRNTRAQLRRAGLTV